MQARDKLDKYVLCYFCELVISFPNDSLGWITYATAGVMQGSLLVMCLIWKARQARLRIDDFGNKLGPDVPTVTVTRADSDILENNGVDENTSLLRRQGYAGQDRKNRGILSRLFSR
jgi:hypothetical protein